MSVQTVTVPASFFRAELRMYADWHEALWRELVQNSLDAGADNMAVSTHLDADGHVVVRFEDDGHGMTRDVLDNVFFALGQTTKGQGAIGGYGRARIITCFAQESYTIHTGNLFVTGHGGTYEVTTIAASQRGCVFEITTILTGDQGKDDLENALKRLVRSSTFKARLTLNGERVWASYLPGRASRILRSDAHPDGWGRAYVLDSYGYGRVQVSVGGLLMFTTWTSGDSTVLVDLDPAYAREVMVASRDSLREPFKSILTEFAESLSTNKARALQRVEPVTMILGGGGFFTTGVPQDIEASEHAVSAPAPKTAVAASGAAFTPRPAEPSGTRGQVYRAKAEYRGDSGVGGDVYLFSDDRKARTAAVQAWNPHQWGTGGNRRKVMLAWKAAVDYCLSVALDKGQQVSWALGVTFDLEAQANTREMNGGFVYALRPVDEDGKMIYKTTSVESMRSLLAVAAHEVAHTFVSDHNESFASVLTGLYGKIDQGAALTAMRAAVRG